MQSAIGIDFGSLTSVIGCSHQGGLNIILNDASERSTPNIVLFG